MAAMFLDPIMDKALELITEKLISAGLRYVKDQVRWQKHTKEELEKLQGILPQIQAIVHFASSLEQITDQYQPLNKWYWQFRDAIDAADDVLDELEYMELEKQVTKNNKLSIVNFTEKKLNKFVKRALKIDPTLRRLEEAVQELYRVSTNGVDNFFRLVEDAKQGHQKQQDELYRAREMGFLPKNDLIGRGKEKEDVMEWLRNPSNEPRGTDLYRNISLLSVVGHGGMGKTTLLQHVYKDEEITKEFDLKMWVFVSNNFDVKKVIADMFESLKKERPRSETLGALQDSLRTEIMSKKFLLVLDDIWEENGDISKWEDKWGNVLAPLADGGFGSKIMVTIRTDSVALIFAKLIKKETIVRLKSLEENDCLQLLKSHAFAGVEPDGHKKLSVIAGEIVKKLLGSPLAAKVIGGVLSSKLDERHWRAVLESNLLGQDSIDSILRLSYIVLSKTLKSCFSFCCMFRQDHKYDKDDLIRMWIALGFIQPSQGMTMEDIGERYFDVLVKKTLLEKVGYDYKMHDLIHESASNFFAHECGKFVGHEESSVKIFKTIRHLSVEVINPNIIKRIGQFKNLHSIFLFYKGSNEQDLCEALIEIFKASTSLRLVYILVIKDFEPIIPEMIGNLIHLRYLRIDGYNLTMLPRSLSNLYHLQYIIYYESRRLSRSGVDNFLPSDINNLSNLRYMKLPKNCITLICGIGMLKFLQQVDMFDLRDKRGYRIGELENMNDLCKLGIGCLENVKDTEEACSAKLYAKRRLTDLSLCWSNTDSRNIDLDDKVLDNLLPPTCLRNLGIWRYMGARSAIWMDDVSLLYNLEKIVLGYCSKWETLPPFWQLPFLKSLKLYDMPKVKWFESKFDGNDQYHSFPLLEELQIWGLEALEDWFEAGVAAEDEGCLFPCLIDLDISNCPKLKELPSLPSKLKRLEIDNIGCTTLNFCSNSNPIPLQRLVVYDCPNITSLPLADEIARLAALRSLIIMKCPNLRSLGRYREEETTNNCHLILSSLYITDPSWLLMEPLRSIASLKELSISWTEVVSFPNEAEQWFLNVSSSLSRLEFRWLESLESLPSSLESLSSLQELFIWAVPMLRELPNLPPSLQRLKIWRCDPELKERYGEDGGSDRHKIAHIPNIEFLFM